MQTERQWYPAVDEMIKIFDENWSDELGVVDMQSGYRSFKGTIQFAVLFNQS